MADEKKLVLPEDILEYIKKQAVKVGTNEYRKNIKDGRTEYINKLLVSLTQLRNQGIFNMKYNNLKKNQQDDYNKMAISMMIILYELRRIFTGQEMMFELGIIDDEGKLKEKTYNQLEVFNLIVENKLNNLNALEKLMEDLKSNETFISESGFSKVLNQSGLGDAAPGWTLMKYWPGFLGTDAPEPLKDIIIKKYRRDTQKRFMVNFSMYKPGNTKEVSSNLRYIHYEYGDSQDIGIINNHYSVADNVWKYFNRGWLYEWYKKHEEDYDRQIINGDFSGKQVLFNIMVHEEIDSIKALEAGDYDKGPTYIPTQVKLGNVKLVGIGQILDKATKILEAFNNEEKDLRALSQDIEKIFVTKKSNLNQGFDNNAQNTLLRILEEFKQAQKLDKLKIL